MANRDTEALAAADEVDVAITALSLRIQNAGTGGGLPDGSLSPSGADTLINRIHGQRDTINAILPDAPPPQAQAQRAGIRR